MKKTVSIYFSNWGYVLYKGGSPISLVTIDPDSLSIEDKLRRAWYYLGRGIADALEEKAEFITLCSDTKVIDQLEGVIIDDEDCLNMARQIKEKGLTRFIYHELQKATSMVMNDKLNEAIEELRG
jgi:hypothetical protein